MVQPKLIPSINLHGYSRAIAFIYLHFLFTVVKEVQFKRNDYLYSLVSSLEGFGRHSGSSQENIDLAKVHGIHQ